MKKNISQKLFSALKWNGLVAVSSAMLLVSCGAQMGGYTETDGVYYDPNRDTLPEATVNRPGNRVGDFYDYQESDYAENYSKYGNYRGWKEKAMSSDSDWGNYTGTERIYSGWDSPFYSFGYAPYYGYASRFGMSFGWGYPFYSYNPFGYYDNFYGYYSPFYGSFYYPYNSYFGYYSPYYGYGSYYGVPYYTAPRRNTGPDGFRVNPNRQNSVNGSGFRSTMGYSTGDRISQYPSRMQSGMRSTDSGRRVPSSDQPRFRTQNDNSYRNEIYRNNNDGFRNGGFRNESGGGGFQSGGSSSHSGGGFRNGGFR